MLLFPPLLFYLFGMDLFFNLFPIQELAFGMDDIIDDGMYLFLLSSIPFIYSSPAPPVSETNGSNSDPLERLKNSSSKGDLLQR